MTVYPHKTSTENVLTAELSHLISNFRRSSLDPSWYFSYNTLLKFLKRNQQREAIPVWRWGTLLSIQLCCGPKTAFKTKLSFINFFKVINKFQDPHIFPQNLPKS